MTRTYENFSRHIESFIYDHNKLVLHCVYYKPSGYGYPRYHFENFCLNVTALNYEICRFMRAVNKINANPHRDLDTLDFDMTQNLFE